MKDISKYLTNKEISLSNEDIDLDSLQKDLLKGYVKESEIEKPDYSGYILKTDFDKLQNDYSELETNYNNTIKKLDDTNEKMNKLSLENVMTRKGFKEADFEEVAKLRNSLYGDEKNDNEAIDKIVARYKDTYFKDESSKFTSAPNEGNLGNASSSNEPKVSISRNTKIQDLIVK